MEFLRLGDLLVDPGRVAAHTAIDEVSIGVGERRVAVGLEEVGVGRAVGQELIDVDADGARNNLRSEGMQGGRLLGFDADRFDVQDVDPEK